MVVKQRGRESRTFKVNLKTWNLFKQAVKEKGFSTCFILETLMKAWTVGATAIDGVIASNTLTVNQNIEYMVERPRRRMVGVIKKHLENVYFNGMWTYRKPESGEILSKLGHVPECECNVCIPYPHPIRVRGGKRLGSRYLK